MSLARPFVVASSNPGKVREIRRLLSPLGYDPVTQSDLAIPSPPETGHTFLANALRKALNVARRAPGVAVLADDSGLEVDLLDGRPGVETSTLAGPGATDAANVARLLELLASHPGPERRAARFVCCLVWLPADGREPLTFTGVCPGRIALAPRGDNGFGYDPVFEIPSVGKTLAELGPEEKDALSHRGQALRELAAFLRASRQGAGKGLPHQSYAQ